MTSSATPTDANTAYVESQVRVLTSNKARRKVIAASRLDSDPEFVGPPSLLSGVRDFIYEKVGRPPSTAERRDGDRAEDIGSADRRASQERTDAPSILSVTSRNGEKSALIANEIVKVYSTTRPRRAPLWRGGRPTRCPGACKN